MNSEDDRSRSVRFGEGPRRGVDVVVVLVDREVENNTHVRDRDAGGTDGGTNASTDNEEDGLEHHNVEVVMVMATRRADSLYFAIAW